MIRKIASLAFVSLLPLAAAAHAAPIEFQSGTFTSDQNNQVAGSDGVQDSSGTATFSINSSGQLVMVLTDTSTGVWIDSQNINGISFKLANGASSFLQQGAATLSSIAGQTITSMSCTSTTCTPTIGNTALPTTDWKNTADGNLNSGANIIEFNAASSAPEAGTIAGATNGSGVYTISGNGQMCGSSAPTNISGTCDSANAFGNPAIAAHEEPMGYDTATFVFTITGLSAGDTLSTDTGSGCTATSTNICISAVQFGFGGSDHDDSDDVTNGLYVPGTNPPATPEPSSLMLLGTGILGAAGMFRSRAKKAAASSI